jgi:hypothetical protein
VLQNFQLAMQKKIVTLCFEKMNQGGEKHAASQPWLWTKWETNWTAVLADDAGK